jgi:hypothetical protein
VVYLSSLGQAVLSHQLHFDAKMSVLRCHRRGMYAERWKIADYGLLS